jgi:threonine dehydrogenase-like Zn-dependent dehydrogenase
LDVWSPRARAAKERSELAVVAALAPVCADKFRAPAVKGRTIRPCVGYVGVPHGLSLDSEELFYAHVHLHGGPAPVRRYLPQLIDLVWKRKIYPGKVFDLTLPLDQVAEGYRAMDERRAIKVLLQP